MTALSEPSVSHARIPKPTHTTSSLRPQTSTAAFIYALTQLLHSSSPLETCPQGIRTRCPAVLYTPGLDLEQKSHTPPLLPPDTNSFQYHRARPAGTPSSQFDPQRKTCVSRHRGDFKYFRIPPETSPLDGRRLPRYFVGAYPSSTLPSSSNSSRCHQGPAIFTAGRPLNPLDVHITTRPDGRPQPAHDGPGRPDIEAGPPYQLQGGLSAFHKTILRQPGESKETA